MSTVMEYSSYKVVRREFKREDGTSMENKFMMKQNCCILCVINRLWQLCTAQSYNMADQSLDKPPLEHAYIYCSDYVCVYRSIWVCMLQWVSLSVLGLANDSRKVRIAILSLEKHVLGTTDNNEKIESWLLP